MTSPQLKSTTNYEIQKILGTGAFGVVSKIKTKDDNKIYALKQIDLRKIKNEEKRKRLLDGAIKEYLLLKKNLKNVVKSYGSFYDQKDEVFNFTMENYPHNLRDLIENYFSKHCTSLTFTQFMPIFRDILTGLCQLLEEASTIHRDVKPENILLNSELKAFVADVGLSKTLEFDGEHQRMNFQIINTLTGTPDWMAPEMVKLIGNQNPEPIETDLSKLDIFSLGLIALFCLDTEEFKKQDGLNKNEKQLERYLETFRKKVPPSFYYMIKCMLSFSPYTRPSLLQLNKDFNFIYPEEPKPCIDILKREIPDEKLKKLLNLDKFNKACCEFEDSKRTQIQLDIFSRKEIDDDAYLYFSKSLTKFNYITELNIQGFKTSITDQGMLYLSSALKELFVLKKLSINIRGTRVADQGTRSLTLALKLMDSLKSIEINLNNTLITDKGVEFLASIFTKMQWLTYCEIGIGENHITDSSVSTLSDVLGNLSSLETLKLNIRSTCVSDKGFENIANSIKKLKTLKNLTIIKGETEISENGESDFASQLVEIHNMELKNNT